MTTATLTSQVMKVKWEKLTACLTCPLCEEFFRDATTISECLHTFCRKCIHDKIVEDALGSCPICKIHLGCAPLEKLRADHNLQDLRLKIFPSNKHSTSAPEAVPSVPEPPEPKEKSPVLLVLGLPAASSETKPVKTGRRSKTGPRKNHVVRKSTLRIEEPVSVEAHQASLSSHQQTFSEPAQSKRQFFTGETSTQRTSAKDDEVEEIVPYGKVDMWKPLKSLVQAASRTKPSKSSKPAVPDAQPRTYQSRKEKAALSEGLSVQSNAIVVRNSESDERCSPIWFSLVASEDQEGDAPLPQIPSSYLRVKDGSLPVSFIKKYIARKLNLLSYAEVEISLWGQPLLSTLQLHSVVNLYAQTFSSPERIRTTTGSSARDFVMVLAYGRCAAAQPRPLQAYYTDAYSHHRIQL